MDRSWNTVDSYELACTLSDEAVVRAYHHLSALRGTKVGSTYGRCMRTARIFLSSTYDIVLAKYPSITIHSDGSLTVADAAGQPVAVPEYKRRPVVMARIEDLTPEALSKAAEQLGKLLPPGTQLQSEDDGGPARIEEALELLSTRLSVTIAEDGTVDSQPISRIVTESSEARVSPGLARMRARLGTEGTEELRTKVLSDGDAALQVAAQRSDHLSEVNSDAGGDAGMAAALASVRGEASPDLAAAAAQAVARATAAKGKPLDELNKMLSRELQPQAREILRRHIADQVEARSDAPTNARTVPAPRAEPQSKRATGRGAGKAQAFADTDVITLKVSAGTNPKRAGAAVRFSKYVTGMTVAQYAAAIEGGAKQAARDLVWDTSQGFIEVSGPTK